MKIMFSSIERGRRDSGIRKIKSGIRVVADVAILNGNGEKEGWTGRVGFAYILVYIEAINLQIRDSRVPEDTMIDDIADTVCVAVIVGKDHSMPKNRHATFRSLDFVNA
jgi:hypothetical protein